MVRFKNWYFVGIVLGLLLIVTWFVITSIKTFTGVSENSKNIKTLNKHDSVFQVDDSIKIHLLKDIIANQDTIINKLK